MITEYKVSEMYCMTNVLCFCAFVIHPLQTILFFSGVAGAHFALCV